MPTHLGGHNAKGSEQSPTSVDDLKLTEAAECGGVCRETCAVPSVISRELASQVGWGLTSQRACTETSISASLHVHEYLHSCCCNLWVSRECGAVCELLTANRHRVTDGGGDIR